MSDTENTEEIVETKKEKKPRTEKQKLAFEKMIQKRAQIDEIKRQHKTAIKTEKELKLKEKVNKIKEVEDKMSKYKSDEEEEELVEPTRVRSKSVKPRQRPKKVVYEETSSEEEPEIVYVKKSKPKKKKAKKKVVVEETSSESSEEEEIKPVKSKKKYATTELVNQRSNDELKAELVNQRLLTAMRSLGYID